MSAPVVSIRRLTATAHLDAGSVAGLPEPATRIRRLLASVAERRLDRAVQAVALPEGMWCLRRLDVPVRLDLAAPDPAVEERWAAVLAAALSAALREPGRAVRFSSERDALADLVTGISLGHLDRVWAWRQLGLVRPGHADPAEAPRDAMLASLARHPDHAAGAVALAVERAGLAALHRTLGEAGWTALAEVVAGAAGGGRRLVLEPGAVIRSTGSTAPSWVPEGDAVADRQAGEGHDPDLGLLRESPEHLTGAPRSDRGAPISAGMDLATRLVRSSRVAAAIRRSMLRPPQSVVAAWAVLVAVEVDPSILRRTTAPYVLAYVAAALVVSEAPRSAVSHRPPPLPADPAPGAQPIGSSATPVDTNPTDVASALPTGVVRNALPGDQLPADASRVPTPALNGTAQPTPDKENTRSDEDAGDRAYPTEYAGLLFLIATAPAADVPDAILAETAFMARTLPWVLHHVALCLGVPAADPAAAAFGGHDPGNRLPWLSDEPPTDIELEAVTVVAGRWSHATAAALRRLDDPDEVVRSVLRRTGLIRYAPGWIDVRMPVDKVDLEVRRAGLDLDPGWVPWLGTVVRYVYE